MLDLEGVASSTDHLVAGDEAVVVEADLRRLVDAGATELIPVPVGNAEQVERTLGLLGALAAPIPAGTG